MTPDLVLEIRDAAKTLMVQIHIRREFVEGEGVPRLGPQCRSGSARPAVLFGTATR